MGEFFWGFRAWFDVRALRDWGRCPRLQGKSGDVWGFDFWGGMGLVGG